MAGKFLFPITLIVITMIGGCSASATKPVEATAAAAAEASKEASGLPATGGARIKIEPNSPADTVRVFYKHLRERKFRDALFLTNLRPAIEGLTEAELKEFQVDFEAVAKHVPAEIEINGEIVSGDLATVTANLPNDDLDGHETQQIELRRTNGVWVILTVDEKAEKRIRAEGKRYFAELKIETHENEARDMLDRISKAQMAYSIQNKGLYGSMQQLIGSGLLPPDAASSESTGYSYSVAVTENGSRYSAQAVPAAYGKTGRLTFFVKLDENSQPHLTSKDNKGR